MKLLLDEQMPRKIARYFLDSYSVDHVQLVGWSGIKNGALLKLAAESGYDALISADKNMAYQHDEGALEISVVVLHVNQLRIQDLAALLPTALQKLQTAEMPSFIRVEGTRV